MRIESQKIKQAILTGEGTVDPENPPEKLALFNEDYTLFVPDGSEAFAELQEEVTDINAAISGLVVGVATSGPATIHYYGSVTDTDGEASAHPTWSGYPKSVIDPSGTVDQLTYDGTLRLTSYREFGVVRTITYATSGVATGLPIGVS